MSMRSLKICAATVLVACVGAVMPPDAVASPGSGRVVAGDAHVPLQPFRGHPKPFIDIFKKLFPTKAPPVKVTPPPPASTQLIWSKTFRQNQVVEALKRLGKKGAAEAVKWATCEALEANFDYTADYDGWVHLIVSYLPQDVVDEAVENDYVMTIVADAIYEVASPLSELTSHWTGPFYVAACS
jgi:hypothetical protein